MSDTDDKRDSWTGVVVEGSYSDIQEFLREKKNFPIDFPCVGPRGQTALCYTITYGLGEKTRMLLALGADVNQVSPWEGGTCQTPLTAAIDREDIAVIGLLLQYGANPTLPALNAWEYATTKRVDAATAAFFAYSKGVFNLLPLGPRKNLKGDKVNPGCATREHRGVNCKFFWYCGQNVREAGKCPCGNCGPKCGPTDGCPCATCLRMVSPEIKEQLQTSSDINSEAGNGCGTKRSRIIQ